MSVPISGVTVLLFFFLPSSRSTLYPSPTLLDVFCKRGSRSCVFFATVFFSPGEGRYPERGSTISSLGKPFRQADRNESKRRIAGSQDLPPGIGIYEASTWILGRRRWRDMSDVTRTEWRTPFSIICWSRAMTSKRLGDQDAHKVVWSFTSFCCIWIHLARLQFPR